MLVSISSLLFWKSLHLNLSALFSTALYKVAFFPITIIPLCFAFIYNIPINWMFWVLITVWFFIQFLISFTQSAISIISVCFLQLFLSAFFNYSICFFHDFCPLFMLHSVSDFEWMVSGWYHMYMYYLHGVLSIFLWTNYIIYWMINVRILLQYFQIYFT